MSDVIGRGVIEVSADSTKFKAGIDDARRTIKSFGKDIEASVGTASASASKSIDAYVRRLETSAATAGKTTRETELYKLALRGASEAQLAAANSALRLNERYEQGAALGATLRTGLISVATAGAAAAAAIGAGTIALIGQVGKYTDLAEKIGDTAANISSLKTAADVSGTSLDTISAASVKLTAALSKTDDEGKLVGASIKALGLNFDEFKKKSPVEQLQAVAQAFETFADGSEKTAVAVGLFGKNGAELLSFLKEYAADGLKAAYVTAEQAKAADDYSDSAARARSQIQQFLQVAAVNTIPLLTDIGDLFRSIAQDQGQASAATDLLKGAMGALTTILQTVLVVGSDVGFVLLGVGREIGAIAAQAVALANLDFHGFTAISDAVKEDGERARKELDKFQARVLAIGQPAAAVDPRILGNPGTIAQQTAANRRRLNIAGLNQDAAAKAAKEKADKVGISAIFDAQEAFRASELASQAKVNEALRTDQLTEAEKRREAGLKLLLDDQQRLAQILGNTPKGQLEAVLQDVSLINAAFDEGQIGAETWAQAVLVATGKLDKRLADVKDTGAEVARELGMTFESAFENAIVGGESLRKVINGIGQDLARLVIRKSITEPFAASISGGLQGADLGSLFASFFGGGKAGGGAVQAGMTYLVGERGPELFSPAGSGSITPNGAIGGTTVVQNVSIDARGADAGVELRIQRAMRQAKAETLAAVQAQANRGGSFARAVGRA